VSTRIFLGTRGAIAFANSNEHLEYGYTTVEPEAVKAMGDKRAKKSESLKREIREMQPVRTFGSDEADVTMVGWGSTKGPVLEGLKMLRKDGIEARFVQILYIEPFPKEECGNVLDGEGKFVLFEANRTSQLGQLIKLNNDFEFDHVVTKYDGRPFDPVCIYEKVKEVL
jgi:2-oxoglutarate ferredoxin oxidoreductase subunit alpha